MLTRKDILGLFKMLDRELGKAGSNGEIGLCGGAVMCVVFKARESTKDVDAVFEPTRVIRDAAACVAEMQDIPRDWLNDAAKGFFISDPPRESVWEGKHLKVWAPSARYMLAMKCVAARFDTHDRSDVAFLIGHLGFKKVDEVFRVIEEFYPRKLIPAKTRFLVEELMDPHTG